MSLLNFPILIGAGFAVRSTVLSGIVQTAEAGNEVRIPSYPQARYNWAIPYDYLPAEILVATADWQTMSGFHEQMLGTATAFLYTDQNDYDTELNVSPGTLSQIGIGDATTTTFQLARVAAFGTPHLVYYVNATNRAARIYLNGALQSSGYSISATGLVTFGSAPGAGVVVAWDGQYYFLVRFVDDKLDATNVAGPYWKINEVNLIETQG